jgi:hypothetical protein
MIQGNYVPQTRHKLDYIDDPVASLAGGDYYSIEKCKGAAAITPFYVYQFDEAVSVRIVWEGAT